MKSPKKKVLDGMIVIVVLAMVIGVAHELITNNFSNATVERGSPVSSEAAFEKLLVDAFENHRSLPVHKTLYEGTVSGAKVQFYSYRHKIAERLSHPTRIDHGKGPHNQGAKYTFWDVQINGKPHTVGLFLRGVSEHYQNRGIKAQVEFSVGNGQ